MSHRLALLTLAILAGAAPVGGQTLETGTASSALPAASAAAPGDPAAPAPAGDAPVFYETATVTARPLSSATASVTVVERQEVERSGARTIGELMRFIPGVDISTNGSRGGLTTAQLRGGDEKSMVLLDGVPVNDDTYQVGSVFDLEGLPADSVERIEVVRGPLSSFFGSTGLAGVVNVITRRGAPGPSAVRLAAAGGRRPGVEDPQAGPGLVERDVRMPEHHQVRARERAAHPGQPARGRSAGVQHAHPEPLQVELGGRRGAPFGHVRAVVVPGHRGHRGVLRQFGQDGGGADVARVQDQVRLAQVFGPPGRADPPPPRRMSVSQDHDPHGP